MVENTVVKDQLTEAMVDSGAELTRKLDELGLAICAAFWYFMPEINEWRLLFASPEVSERGPRGVYEKIQLALEQLGERAAAAPLSAIGLLDQNADLVKALRTVIRAGNGIGRLRISKNAALGHFIDDALIYRAS